MYVSLQDTTHPVELAAFWLLECDAYSSGLRARVLEVVAEADVVEIDLGVPVVVVDSTPTLLACG